MKPLYRLIDCFSPLTAADAKALHASGYHGVCRYLGAKTNPQWGKGVTPSEAHTLISAGLKIVSNWEGNPTRPGYFTIAQAHLDATQAVEEAEWLGQPRGTTIYFSVDCNLAPNTYAAAIAYFAEIKRVLAGKYKVGAYGSDNVLRALAASDAKADYYWQTIAWSGGRFFNHANLYQDKVNQKVDGRSVDIDEVYIEPGWWPIDPAPTPPSKPVVPRFRIALPDTYPDLQHATQVALDISKLGITTQVEEVH